ncbi:MAG: GNAT family N-acetyltransferase [Bacteroidales bacterium]|nr:GNAT family N-acetyltransferase [Bacteroidales bacterium]
MEFLQNELYFKIADTDFELQSCYRLRFHVYCKEKRWLSPGKFPDELEIDEYDDKAVHVIAMDENFKIVGMMRILKESDYKKLPFLDHPGLKGTSFHAPNMAELSRFIVNATQNRYYVLKGLIRAVYQTSRKIGVDNWIFVSEPSLVRFLERFKFYFDPICPPAKYYGGFTLAAQCDIGRTEAIWHRSDHEALMFNQAEAAMMTNETVMT